MQVDSCGVIMVKEMKFAQNKGFSLSHAFRYVWANGVSLGEREI